MNYRERIFSRYASSIQNSDGRFDPVAASNWGDSYQPRILPWLPQDKKCNILEIACGNGRLLYCLKTWGYSNITGIDISPEQVKLSRQVLGENRIHHAEAISYLLNNQNTFDIIIGLDLIEHFTKDEILPFLDAVNQSLRLGGALILQSPNADSPFGLSYRYGDFTHEIIFNQNSLSSLLKISDFNDIQFQEVGPSVRGITSFLRFILWLGFRQFILLWNLAETGSKGSGIATRNMLAYARKNNSLK